MIEGIPRFKPNRAGVADQRNDEGLVQECVTGIFERNLAVDDRVQLAGAGENQLAKVCSCARQAIPGLISVISMSVW